MAHLGTSIHAKLKTSNQALSNPRDDPILMKSAMHTQHEGNESGPLSMAGQTVVAKVRKHVLVPTEEEVEVPVVRKEIRKTMGKQTIKCQRLVPVTKYKEITETTLETREEIVNGKKEKRAVPITTTRKQPYQDFEEQEYEMVIDVPKEEVVTRTGTRKDKQVTSKIVEVEQEHVYELRPVLISKGTANHRHIGDHHKFKHSHGRPAWDDDVKRGWLGKPQTPEFKSHLHRPRSSGQILGSNLDREKFMHSSAGRSMMGSSGGRSMLGTSGGRLGTSASRPPTGESRLGTATGLPMTMQGSASSPQLGRS